jgi:hypothetical protein
VRAQREEERRVLQEMKDWRQREEEERREREEEERSKLDSLILQAKVERVQRMVVARKGMLMRKRERER